MARKNKGVYERSPGVWAIEWWDDTGRRRRRTIGKEADAIVAAEQMRARTRLTKIAPELAFDDSKTKTLDEVMEYCNETRELKKRVKRLYDGYRRSWNKWLPGATLTSVTTELLERWRAARRKSKTYRGDPVTKTTVNRELGYLKMVFKMAIDRGWVRENPTVLLKQYRENNRKDEFYEPEQMEAILNLQEERFGIGPAIITEIAVQTGMRQSEQFELERKDLNLPLGLIRLNDPKSGKKEWVELNERAIELFTIFLDNHDSHWVFPSRWPRHAGRHIDGLYFSNKYFVPIVEELGFEGTWHQLRHTYGSWLRIAGVDLADIRDLMRHSDTIVTERYAHIGNADRKESVNRLASVFRRDRGEEPPRLRLVQ